MISVWVGLLISLAAIVFGVVQVRRGERNGRLAIALGIVGLLMNLYAMTLIR